MFATLDTDEMIPERDLATPGERWWTFIQIAISRPWFIVPLVLKAERRPTVDHTVMVAHPSRLTDLQQHPGLLLERVWMVSPRLINGTDGWRIDELSEVWVVQGYAVYVLQDGRRLAPSTIDVSKGVPNDAELIFRLAGR